MIWGNSMEYIYILRQEDSDLDYSTAIQRVFTDVALLKAYLDQHQITPVSHAWLGSSDYVIERWQTGEAVYHNIIFTNGEVVIG